MTLAVINLIYLKHFTLSLSATDEAFSYVSVGKGRKQRRRPRRLSGSGQVRMLILI
jgi:hypothetical protein